MTRWKAQEEVLIEGGDLILSGGGDEPQADTDELVSVRAINMNAINGRVLVYETQAISQAYMVLPGEIKNSVGEQFVSRKLLNESPRPYSWDNEIDHMVYTKDQIRLAFYWLDLVEAPSVKLNPRELISKLLRNGTLPIVR